MNAESLTISSISALSAAQQEVLKRAGLTAVIDMLLTSPGDVAKRCRLSLKDVDNIMDIICNALAPEPRALEDVRHEGAERFTTGDEALDEVLGGGIRTGMLWEVVGESAAGKTQLALQLSLLVQVPVTLGGIAGSACYLTTSSTLPTERLMEISKKHPLLSPSLCGLSDVHTIQTPEIPILLRVLSITLPALVEQLAAKHAAKPVKLLVIDTLTELFHSHGRVSTATLSQRSKNLNEISALLHSIANKYQIAVLVLNEVMDVMDRDPSADPDDSYDLVYRDQAQFFNRADSIPGERRKEASMGLVWANQINTRIMLSRTERLRHLEDTEHRKRKRRRLEDQSSSNDQLTRIRRLSIVFNHVASPQSLDYIVTDEGIATLPQTTESYPPPPPTVPAVVLANPLGVRDIDGVSPLDAVATVDTEADGGVTMLDEDASILHTIAEAETGPELEDDEWYWQASDSHGDSFGNIDFGSFTPPSSL